MTNRDNADNLTASIEAIHDSETGYSVFPVPIQFSHERGSGMRIETECANRSFDAAFDVRRDMTNDFGNVRWDIRVIHDSLFTVFLF